VDEIPPYLRVEEEMETPALPFSFRRCPLPARCPLPSLFLHRQAKTKRSQRGHSPRAATGTAAGKAIHHTPEQLPIAIARDTCMEPAFCRLLSAALHQLRSNNTRTLKLALQADSGPTAVISGPVAAQLQRRCRSVVRWVSQLASMPSTCDSARFTKFHHTFLRLSSLAC
jgi:hypothetical protein